MGTASAWKLVLTAAFIIGFGQLYLTVSEFQSSHVLMDHPHPHSDPLGASTDVVAADAGGEGVAAVGRGAGVQGAARNWNRVPSQERIRSRQDIWQDKSKLVPLGDYMSDPNQFHADAQKCLKVDDLIQPDWTSYVIIQVDNRISTVQANSRDWNHTDPLYLPRAAWLYNLHMAKHYGYHYLLFVPPPQCKLLDGRIAAGYWCKVPYMAMVSKMFPNAQGILFMDSDAYISSTVDVYMANNGIATEFAKNGKMLSDDSPLYLHQDNGYWNRTMTSYWPQVFPFETAVNTGAMFWHPKSKAAVSLGEWWFHTPYVRDEMELRSTCLYMTLQFSQHCNHAWDEAMRTNATAELMHAAISGVVRAQLSTAAADEFDRLTPPSHFTRCGDAHFPCTPQTWWCKEHFPCWNEYVNQTSIRYDADRHILSFTVRELAHIDLVNFLKDTDNHQRLARALGDGFDCPAAKLTHDSSFEKSFIEEWPGDQQRMQQVIKDRPNTVHILDHMQDLWSDYDVPTEADHASNEPYQASRCPKGCLVLHPSPRDLRQRTAGRTMEWIRTSNLSRTKTELTEQSLQQEFHAIPVVAGDYTCTTPADMGF